MTDAAATDQGKLNAMRENQSADAALTVTGLAWDSVTARRMVLLTGLTRRHVFLARQEIRYSFMGRLMHGIS